MLAVPRPRMRRLAGLYAGLALFGASVALLVRAGLGLDPWDVFHQGLARRTGLDLGWVVIAVSGGVLLLWWPLRQRPGLGTLSNVLLVGLSLDATLAVLPQPHPLALRVAYLVAAILLNGLATGLYIGAGLGPGPRDGLMTGLAARGVSIRAARTAIEVTVLVAGWLLGGTVGVGTLLYAVSIGPLAHAFIPRLTVARTPDPAAPRPERRPSATIPPTPPVAAAGGHPPPDAIPPTPPGAAAGGHPAGGGRTAVAGRIDSRTYPSGVNPCACSSSSPAPAPAASARASDGGSPPGPPPTATSR